MLRAVCEGARAFGDPQLRALALRNGEFLRSTMVRDGRVIRSYKGGSTRDIGFLEDHGAVALAFLDLYALTFDASWLEVAQRVAEATIARFYDEGAGLFFDTPADHEALITRPRDITDNAVPSGTSLVAELLLRLAIITGDARSGRLAADILAGVSEPLGRYPSAFGHLLGVADMAVHGATEVTLAGRPEGDDFRLLSTAVAAHYLPSLVLAGGLFDPATSFPMLHGREAREGKATAYVCRGYTCDAPTQDAGELESQLREGKLWTVGGGR